MAFPKSKWRGLRTNLAALGKLENWFEPRGGSDLNTLRANSLLKQWGWRDDFRTFTCRLDGKVGVLFTRMTDDVLYIPEKPGSDWPAMADRALAAAVETWFRAQVLSGKKEKTWPAMFSVVVATLIGLELNENQGNLSHTAKSMGIARETLRGYLKRYL